MHLLPLLFAIHNAAVPMPASELARNNTGPEVFAVLSRLVGDWQGTGARHSLKVSYRMTANNTVLVETWTMSPTRESMTLYALDGDGLLATHYCPQGNQPRLRYHNVGPEGRFQFVFKDATNLQDQQAQHQHAMWIQLDQPADQSSAQAIDQFSRGETYVSNQLRQLKGDEADDIVQFVRVKPNAQKANTY